jgi:hypothetical protein
LSVEDSSKSEECDGDGESVKHDLVMKTRGPIDAVSGAGDHSDARARLASPDSQDTRNERERERWGEGER